jgi:NAD(P)-dependent dehydrogenase (short-subunit alcohol dehydrogenase family)
MGTYSASELPGLSGQTVIITGATSGIGQATATALARAGAHIVIAARNTAKGAAVAASIEGSVEVRPLDLSSLASVREFAASWAGPVYALVNNAGVHESVLRRTADGFEMTFGTNHLGHFTLTSLLLPHVTGRVVTVASQAERMARLDLDDLSWERRPYAAARAYNDSKLANLLFTSELDRRLAASGSKVRAYAAHPGLVTTPMYDKPAGARRGFFDRIMPLLGQAPDHGALPTIFAVTQDLPGNTFVGPQHLMHMRGGAEIIGRSGAARDQALAARLWDVSSVMTGVPA